MHSIPRFSHSGRFRLGLLLGLVLLGTGACAHLAIWPGEKPPASEFGFGPRVSEHGLYTVALEPAEALRARRLQKISVLVRDAAGQAISGATLSVDGGMPQHGHGLPTQPRAIPASAHGTYAIEGLRFNMGGWWVLALTIDGPLGADRVIFHLQI
ncbi:FixH family protein [Horticoccus luteus]|uniref:FixH family protein n=1 Tax=Horticoccus luteus TaxID=2862869 RepID=A0A8F9TSE2_9BACT|nr:FixH family protein [Horticoccus luteus]QYM78359.1 FixH family protein [Horticoccus luteus]